MTTTATTLVKSDSFLGKDGLANDPQQGAPCDPGSTIFTHVSQQVFTNAPSISACDQFSQRYANPSKISTQKAPNTPRTSSQTTLSSVANEPFQFDCDSHCASLKSLDSDIDLGSTVSLSPTNKTLSSSPKCTSFVGDEFPNAMSSDCEREKQRPQHEDLDADLSVGTSFSASLGSNSRHYCSKLVRAEPPIYISSGGACVSPIQEPRLELDVSAKDNMKPKIANAPNSTSGKRWQGRKVQPLVYSAIGSLETIHHNSYGSFNDRLDKVTTSAKIRKKKKAQGTVDVNATTSQISARGLQQTVYNTNVVGKSSSESNLAVFDTKRASNLLTGASREERHSIGKNDLSLAFEGKKSSCSNTITQTAPSREGANGDKVTSTLKLEENKPDTNVKPSKAKKKKKKVRINSNPNQVQQVELFRPSCDAYTPRMGRKEIKYKPAEQRLKSMGETVHNVMGTIQKPNFQDALRRVAMIIQQHILKIERRFQSGADHLNLFEPAMRDAFSEENFITPRYKCTMVNVPMARGGVIYGMRKIRVETSIPTADDIYEFGHRLFKQVQLSSECSIICLIYVERIMESAKVPMLAKTWKPIFMCGLLLASKVWQDWSSWNIEFANVYPQFSLEAINKLELQFLKMVKWDLYISSSLYAKYYFALRSLLEKQDFRRRYVRMVGGVDSVSASQAIKISKRTELLKEKSLACLSKSV